MGLGIAAKLAGLRGLQDGCVHDWNVESGHRQLSAESGWLLWRNWCGQCASSGLDGRQRARRPPCGERLPFRHIIELGARWCCRDSDSGALPGQRDAMNLRESWTIFKKSAR